MIDAAMLERDREELAQGLEKLRAQQAEMARAVLMQEGALWYVERLLGMANESADNATDNAVETEE